MPTFRLQKSRLDEDGDDEGEFDTEAFSAEMMAEQEAALEDRHSEMTQLRTAIEHERKLSERREEQ